MSAAHGRAIMVNRAPVLTLWAAVVAHRLGFHWEEALTFGRAVAGLNAHAKGVSLGLFTPAPKAVKAGKKTLKASARLYVNLLHRAVPVIRTRDGLRAAGKGRPIDPDGVARYLQAKFGDRLDEVKGAMEKLAHSMPSRTLADEAFPIYEKFRPKIPPGVRGWGAVGRLDLARVRALEG